VVWLWPVCVLVVSQIGMYNVGRIRLSQAMGVHYIAYVIIIFAHVPYLPYYILSYIVHRYKIFGPECIHE
jgi:phosphatidylserine synthase